eukprot:Em0014g104a
MPCKQCGLQDSAVEATNSTTLKSPAQVSSTWIPVLPSADQKQEQQSDPDIQQVTKWLLHKTVPLQFPSHGSYWLQTLWSQSSHLLVNGGILYRKWEDVLGKGENRHLQLVLPKALVKPILQELHNAPSGSHLGITKTLDKVRSRFYWPGQLELHCKVMVQASLFNELQWTFWGHFHLPTETNEYVQDMRFRLEQAYQQVRDRLNLQQRRQKALYDRGTHGSMYAVGDLVWLHRPAVPRGKSPKLHRYWQGPYSVVKLLGKVLLQIQHRDNARKRVVVHFARLKPYMNVSQEENEQPTGKRQANSEDEEEEEVEDIRPMELTQQRAPLENFRSFFNAKSVGFWGSAPDPDGDPPVVYYWRVNSSSLDGALLLDYITQGPSYEPFTTLTKVEKVVGNTLYKGWEISCKKTDIRQQIENILEDHEKRYSAIDKKALAITFEVTKFHQHIFGLQFILCSDHKPLERILCPKKEIPKLAVGRLQRWALLLSTYNYFLRQIQGKDNVIADALSRLPVKTLNFSTMESIGLNHSLLKENRQNEPETLLYSWNAPTEPWTRIHIDYAGPFEGKYWLIVIDAYSKWLEIVSHQSITTLSTIKSLREIFSRFGVPKIFVSDNGTQFASKEFEAFCYSNNIIYAKSTPYHPKTNRLAERAGDSVARLASPDTSPDTPQSSQYATGGRTSGHAKRATKSSFLQRLYRINPGACIRWLLDDKPPVYCTIIEEGITSHFAGTYAAAPPLAPPPPWLFKACASGSIEGDVLNEAFTPDEVLQQLGRMKKSAPRTDGIGYANWCWFDHSGTYLSCYLQRVSAEHSCPIGLDTHYCHPDPQGWRHGDHQELAPHLSAADAV